MKGANIVGNYMVSLKLTKKKAVVIGGGQIAYRKLISLLQAGAYITVISPSISKEIENLYDTHKIIWEKKRFEKDDLQDAFIVIAATNDQSVNADVAVSAHQHQL